jgi:DNA-binding ferritin-like protein (Dps family)
MKTKHVMLLMTVILSAILVTGAFWFAFNGKQSENVNMSFFLTIMIMLATAAVIAAVLVKKRNDRRLKMLNESYREVYDQCVLYIQASGIGFREAKMVADDLLELFHDAQVSGRDVKAFVGNNQKAFADDILATFGGRNSFLFHEISGLQFFIGYLLIIKWVVNMEQINSFEAYLSNQIDISTVLLFALISFILIPSVFFTYIRGLINKKMWVLPVSLIGFPVILFGLFILFIRIVRGNLMEYAWAKSLVDGTTVIFDSSVFVYLGILTIVLLFFLKGIIRKHVLKKNLLV